jgi:hypothetical protein
MDILGPEIEVLWYLKDAEKLSWNTSQDYLYERFDANIIQNLIVNSFIGYGPKNSFILTDIGKDLIMSSRHDEDKVGKNYTRPNDKEYEDDPEDWLASALVFGKALGHMLRENEGVVVKLENDMLDLKVLEETDFNKVIVYNHGDQIHIINCDQDLKDGQLIWMEHGR